MQGAKIILPDSNSERSDIINSYRGRRPDPTNGVYTADELDQLKFAFNFTKKQIGEKDDYELVNHYVDATGVQRMESDLFRKEMVARN